MYPTHPQAQFGGPAPQRKGWWGRNWKWFVPTGCLVLIVGLVAFVAAVVLIAMTAIKSTDVYRQALARARTDAEVVEHLGEPIKDGWFVKGSVNTAGSHGYADFEIPVTGPKKKGTLYATALKEGGEWQFTTLELAVEGMEGRHSLLEPVAPPAPPDYTSEVESGGVPPPPPLTRPSANANSRPVISGGVLNGKAISKPQPPYPAIAKAAKAQGTVTVQVTVDEAGQVIAASAVSGHPLLQQAAVQGARQARFAPTLLAGKPVKVSGVLTYNFRLDESGQQ
jgi:TonB family protein